MKLSAIRKSTPLLEVRRLCTVFHTPQGMARAVDSLDLSIEPGEIVGLVGESGSGKTVTALSILGLIQPPGEIQSGEIRFDGIDLHSLSEEAWSEIRGARIALIFQDPKIRLNPVFSIGSQITEVLQVHEQRPYREAWDHALRLLEEVELADVEARAYAYPHELSMGQAQRAMIAMALALEPDLLIADEPTSSLDATIQAQILELIQSHQSRTGMAVLLISHDLAIVAQIAQRVVVLYAGHVLEEAPVEDLYALPLHPYTQGLIASIPYNQTLDKELYSIPGTIPDPHDLPSACRFAPRCDARQKYQLEICERLEPSLQPIASGHQVRCWLYNAHDGHTPPIEPGMLIYP